MILSRGGIFRSLSLNGAKRSLGYYLARNFAKGHSREIEVSYTSTRDSFLASLFIKYGSDKAISVSRKTGNHTYADFYSLIFAGIRNHVNFIFECGIGSINPGFANNMGPSGSPGASLRAWREYFPMAQIYGADIDESILFTEDRIQTCLLDQTNPQSIKKMWAGLGEHLMDIIIDDGLHRFDAGITLFENSIERLQVYGYYVIEDVSHHDLLKYKNYFQSSNYDVMFVRLLASEVSNFSDNNLILIRHLN